MSKSSTNTEGANQSIITLPCKVGDTVFFIDSIDCQRCKKVEECPGSRCGMTAPKPFDYDQCPQELVRLEVDRIEIAVDVEETVFTLNDCYQFGLNQLDEIMRDYETAYKAYQLVALKQGETYIAF